MDFVAVADPALVVVVLGIAGALWPLWTLCWILIKSQRWQFTIRDAGIAVTCVCLSLALMPYVPFLASVLFGTSIGYFIGRMDGFVTGFLVGVLGVYPLLLVLFG